MVQSGPGPRSEKFAVRKDTKDKKEKGTKEINKARKNVDFWFKVKFSHTINS